MFVGTPTIWQRRSAASMRVSTSSRVSAAATTFNSIGSNDPVPALPVPYGAVTLFSTITCLSAGSLWLAKRATPSSGRKSLLLIPCHCSHFAGSSLYTRHSIATLFSPRTIAGS